MIKIEIKGLEAVSREMEDLAVASARLNGDITQVKFNPKNAGEVDRAISEMENAIDVRVGSLVRSASVRHLVTTTKQAFRERIEARVRQGSDNEDPQ